MRFLAADLLAVKVQRALLGSRVASAACAQRAPVKGARSRLVTRSGLLSWL